MTLVELFSRPSGWMSGVGPDADVVLSSRVRLARNLADSGYPHRLDDLQRGAVFRKVSEACRAASSLERASHWNLEDVSARERLLFVERQLASPDLAGGSGPRGVAVAPDEELGVMINEEDHVRIQSVTSGLNLQKSLERAVALDHELEEVLDYAVSDDLGYLTACPSNVGTGLRGSVLIHLPALVLTGEVRKVHRAVGEMGMAVRGWFGEGSRALGDSYQVSNQRTLGRTEEQTLEELGRVARRILELETSAREQVRDAPGRLARIEDRVWRSWAVLRHARLLSIEQLMSCVSDLRLGTWLGLLGPFPPGRLNALALFAQPGHLGALAGKELEDDAESWARAEWVRSELVSATQNE